MKIQVNFPKLFYVKEFELVNEKKKNDKRAGTLEISMAKISPHSDKIPPEVQKQLDKIKKNDSIK